MFGSGRMFVPTALTILAAAHATAGPVTLQFEAVGATGFVEQGYALDSGATILSSSAGVPAPSLGASIDGQDFTLTGADDRSFDLHALQLGEADVLAGPQQLVLEGDRRGGGTVTIAFTTDGIEGFERFVLPPRFSDLLRLRWAGNTAMLIDAIELSSGIDFTRLPAGVRSYVEDGLLLTSAFDLVAHSEGAPAPALAGPSFGQTHTLTPVHGGRFSVTRLYGRALLVPAPATITFVGSREDGSTVSTTFTTDSVTGEFESFDFSPDFERLVRLQWSDAPDFVLDALETDFEPALNVSVRSAHEGRATVFTMPNGGGRPLSAAHAWNGVVGASPAVVDATVQARAHHPGGLPASGVDIALRTSAGNVVWCEEGDRFDAATDDVGLAAFSGTPRAGGTSDPEGGERTLVFVPDHPGSRIFYSPRLIASRNDGNLYAIEPSTGVATPLCIGTLSGGSTEIVFQNGAQTIWVQPPGLGFVIAPFDLQTCATTGLAIDNGAAMNGLEFVGDDLYGVGITSPCGASDLYRIDVVAGTTTVVGATGLSVPVSGLAFDVRSGTLYGVTGCTSVSGSDLVAVDLATGEALVIGSLGVSLGSIAFGADGALYGVGNSRDGGDFYRIDPVAHSATRIGTTGTGGLTGLALVSGEAIDLQFNSADIDGDLDVDLGDIGDFSADFGNTGQVGYDVFRSDFSWNGIVNLQDVGDLSAGIGATCGSLAKNQSILSASDSRIGLWFSEDEPVRSVAARAGETLTAHLVVEGTLAREGIRAWAARLRVPPNVEILDWKLPPGAIDFGIGNDRVVGTGSPVAAATDALPLASVIMRVLDEHPAHLYLEGVPSVSHGSTEPAVAGGSFRTLVAVPGTFGHSAPVAVINAPLAGASEEAASFDGYALRNSPNPFNPATEIHFALPAESRAELRIHDLGGRRVRSIDAGLLSAGPHSLRWDGRDQRGRSVTSGVYVARLWVNGIARGAMVKMLLIE
jgi:hypothetical protein